MNSRPFGNLGIDISASTLALTSTSALQKIYFVSQSLYFCLSKFYMKKTSMVEYFSNTLADLPGSFRRCQSSYSVEHPLTPPSEKRSSTVEIISGVSKTHKAQRLCPLHFCQFVFKSKREHLSNQEKCFLFHLKISFRSGENQILKFHIFKFRDVIKCLSIK